jgi:lipid A 3-O-deacylase
MYRRRLMSRRILALALAASGSLAATQPLGGQTRMLSIRADNDAFDFWMTPAARPDEEYTSGVRIIYENAWMPWWGSRLWSALPRCDRAGAECRTPRSWIGQDIYNPDRGRGNRQLARSRPNAGWLYFGEELRRITDTDVESLGITLGVTGPPSLASVTQRLAHNVAPELNRPIDWTEQIPFEPGVNARYEGATMLADGKAGPVGIQLFPGASVSLGNVLTEMTVSARTRVGYALRNPWLPADRGTPFELAISGGLTGRAVARDLFLDGSMFRDSPRVDREPFVAERELGISLRYDWFELGYNALWRTRTYTTGPKHVWSSMTGGVLFR